LLDGFGAAIGLRAGVHDEVSVALKQRYRSLDVVLTDSGTSALILALRRIVRPGGTVAYPAYGCIDLTTAAIGAGVSVRLYDLDPATLSPDLESVRAVIRRGVDAIVVAHLYGYPADVAGVTSIATDHGIPVIEDAAQGAGGTLGGARLGSIGDVSILSFGRGKGTTAGAGGALLVRTPQLAEWTSRERSVLGSGSRGGIEMVSLVAQRFLTHPYIYKLPSSIPGLKLGEMVYRAPRSPRAMSAAGAAVLRRALRDESRQITSRRERANDLLGSLSGFSCVKPVRPVLGGESGFLRLALIGTRASLTPSVDLGARRGYPMTLAQHSQLAPLIVAGESAGPGSEFLRDRLFTVPTHFRVTDHDIAGVTEWLGGPNADLGALVPAS
jgi:hypothetical protein